VKLRRYGTTGPWVVLLHGGPGAGGYLAPLAEALADCFRVLEPFQRGSGGEALTVARHVADLEELLGGECERTAAAVLGHSWGAVLALAHAAACPGSVTALVLVGCGTFDLPTEPTPAAVDSPRADHGRPAQANRAPRGGDGPPGRPPAPARRPPAAPLFARSGSRRAGGGEL
jgi:pimeloyl-ACP methyl ester carboxylesterase